MKIEAIVGKRGKRMNFEDISELVALRKDFGVNNPLAYFTDKKNLSKQTEPPISGNDKKTRIYLCGSITNPQGFYRYLSEKGFILIDSKITQI